MVHTDNNILKSNKSYLSVKTAKPVHSAIQLIYILGS